MNRIFFSLALALGGLAGHGQSAPQRSLSDYIEAAQSYSPLLKDYRNQTAIQQLEIKRLKALYTHSRLELNGDYLFVPVVSRDGGHTAFEWNAQDGTDYYGYDLGESSGHLHAGVTWTQPLLGRRSYQVAREQARVDEDMARHRIRLEAHQLERTVTEQYLLCRLDRVAMDFADSVARLLDRQAATVHRLAANGLAKRSDVELLRVEQTANAEARAAADQSYGDHLAELNLLCGVTDTGRVVLADPRLILSAPVGTEASLFAEQHRLDSLGVVAALHAFALPYRPRLDLFVDGGMQTSSPSRWYRHFGWSAGLTFSWTLFDGRQRRLKERQSQWQLGTISAYKQNAEEQRRRRRAQCRAELTRYDERRRLLEAQLEGYAAVLADYDRELKAGQLAVVDYMAVLRRRIGAERDYMLLLTNRQIAVAAYNYWNW